MRNGLLPVVLLASIAASGCTSDDDVDDADSVPAATVAFESAATSTVAGLDVAHTGLALWVDGTLRLLHAPLVGEAVQISETSLAERILRIDGQDGIIVARPHEPGAPTVGTPAVEGR